MKQILLLILFSSVTYAQITPDPVSKNNKSQQNFIGSVSKILPKGDRTGFGFGYNKNDLLLNSPSNLFTINLDFASANDKTLLGIIIGVSGEDYGYYTSENQTKYDQSLFGLRSGFKIIPNTFLIGSVGLNIFQEPTDNSYSYSYSYGNSLTEDSKNSISETYYSFGLAYKRKVTMLETGYSKNGIYFSITFF